MGNGSDHRGPAKRDMIIEQGDKHDRDLQRRIDSERARGVLPSYTDEEESSINGPLGINSKMKLPRMARLVIGIGIGVGLCAVLVAAAIVAVLKVWPR